MKRKELFDKIGTDNIFPMLPLVEIAGDQRVLIERHRGVMGYGKQRICVKLSFGTLLVNGCNLEIIHMTKVQLVIAGRISEIVFKRGND